MAVCKIIFLILIAVTVAVNGQEITDCKFYWSEGEPPSVPVEITELPADSAGGTLIIKCQKPETVQDVIRILQNLTDEQK